MSLTHPSKPMLTRLAGLLAMIRDRAPWRLLGFALSATLVGGAVWFLVGVFRSVDLASIEASVRAISWERIALALALVAASYTTLTCYDLFALRTIGRRDIPYRTAATTSLLCYTIGHGVGAMALTSALIRYRCYSPLGLGVMDIAKIAFITGLTFWLGNVVVLGVCLVLEPEAAARVNQLPAWVNQAVAAAGLLAVALYLLWLRGGERAVGRDSWRVTLPSAPLTLLQIGIGVLDLTLAATAMYVLLPAGAAVDYASAVVTFVLATLLGFLSHAPSGLGVFDATILLGLPQIPPAELLASILVFRALYFFLPLVLALIALILREAYVSLAQRGDQAKPPAA